MRICILTEYLSYVGGGERVYCNWANILADKLNHDVVILSLEDADKTFYALSPKVKIVSLKLRPYKYYQHPIRRRLGMIWHYFKDCRIIEEYFSQEKFDCVIGIATNICMLLPNIKTNCPKIGTEHTEYNAPFFLVRLIRNKLYKSLDHLTVLTEDDCKLYKRFLNNVSVMLNPLSFEPNKQSNLEQKILISVGSLSPQKNQKKMLEVFQKVHLTHPDWKLIIYGEGVLRNTLENYAAQLGIKDYVILPGSIQDVASALSEASIFLLTSKIEGFGLVLIEAMACGLPCISFMAPGPNSIIKNEQNGYLIPQGDVEEFAKYVNLLIEDTNKRKSMGEYARTSINKYSMDSSAESWKLLLSNCCNI